MSRWVEVNDAGAIVCEAKECDQAASNVPVVGYECGPNGRFLCYTHASQTGLKFKEPRIQLGQAWYE